MKILSKLLPSRYEEERMMITTSGVDFLFPFPENTMVSFLEICHEAFLCGITSWKKSCPVRLEKLSSQFCPIMFQSTVTFPRPGGVLITWNCKIPPKIKMDKWINAYRKWTKHLSSTKLKSQACNYCIMALLLY